MRTPELTTYPEATPHEHNDIEILFPVYEIDFQH
jgi:hypothetical protein